VGRCARFAPERRRIRIQLDFSDFIPRVGAKDSPASHRPEKQPRAGNALDAARRELLPEGRGGGESGAMRSTDALHVETTERCQGLCQPMRARVFQMHPANHGMDRLPAGQTRHVDERVHDAGVRAPQHDHDAITTFEEHGLVVQERVGLRERLIEKKRPARVLEIGRPRDFARHPHAGDHFARLTTGDDAPAFAPKGFRFDERDAEVTRGRWIGPRKLGLNCAWVQEQWRLRRSRQGCFQSADVVEMAVTEHNRFGRRKIDIQPPGVVDQRHSLAGVKKHAVQARVDPPGQTVFTQDARPAGRVLDQNGEGAHGLT